ncbi:hypothetical protein JCM12296A_49030 [Desulfosarcina cetonica]
MSTGFKCLSGLMILFALAFFAACRGVAVPPIPDEAMEFEAGIKLLADNLGAQLENSEVAGSINKVAINLVTGRKEIKKIAVDPFIDMESGYPVKANDRIVKIMAAEIKERFEITGVMEPDVLEVAGYVLNGMVTLEPGQADHPRRYKVYGAVFEKGSGRVIASASVHVKNFDTTPMDIYKDSPVYLKGDNYAQLTASVRKGSDETVEKGYHDTLTVKSMQVKGDQLYEQKEYDKSLVYYNQAAGVQQKVPLETLNGLFTNYLKQKQWNEAAAAYGKLIRASIAETGELATKITFNPLSSSPVESKTRLYTIYIKEIAKLVDSVPSCRISIVGHCSRSGTEAFNDALSLERAQWILNKMRAYAPGVVQKADTVGRGFRQNIVGSGADDITDEIDRRVEFKFQQCVE